MSREVEMSWMMDKATDVQGVELGADAYEVVGDYGIKDRTDLLR